MRRIKLRRGMSCLCIRRDGAAVTSWWLLTYSHRVQNLSLVQLGLCEQTRMNKQGAMQQIRLGTVEVMERPHSEQYYPRRLLPS